MVNMKDMKEIAFIFPQKSKGGNFVLYPPLGLLYLVSAFKKDNWNVSFINGQLLKPEEYESRIQNIQEPFVGISTIITEIEEAIRTARIIKESDPSKIIMAGGPGISVLDPLKEKNIDIIIKGEADELPSLLERLVFNSRLGGTLIIDCKSPQQLDAIPYPDREILPLEEYLEICKQLTGIAVTTMITSRGCPYNCAFCDKTNSGQKFRARSANNIVDEMELLIARYRQLNEIIICDDFFCCDRERVIDICEVIVKRNLKISWSAQTRVDSIDLEMLNKMKEAGCSELCFGAESGSNRILNYLRKGFDRSQIISAFEMCRQVGIRTGMCLIVGIPGETKKDIDATKELVLECRPYELGVSFLIPFPGTVIYEKTKQWINCIDYNKWHIRNLIYKFPYEIDPKEAREEIFAVFRGIMEEGMECSPFQWSLDY